jgi:ABC-type glycerol-3-phosphate transport system substrate-binding protein
LPEGAQALSISWSSSDSEVASVTGGLVEAKKAGTVIVSAASSVGTVECVVAVEPVRSADSLTIFSMSSEFQDNGMISDYVGRYPTREVHLLYTESVRYEAALKSIYAGPGLKPDIFVGESGWVKDVVELGISENLSAAPYNAVTSDQFDYCVQMGRDRAGALRGITWQATPGGFFYRRSIALDVFGSGDPAVVQGYFDTWEHMRAAGLTLKDAGYSSIPGPGDLARIFFAQKTTPYVDASDAFSLDPAIAALFDTAKEIRTLELDGGMTQWSDPWGAEMDSAAGEATVFAFPLPTWGLTFILSGCANSSGDWGLIRGPGTYYWGGTWLLISNTGSAAQKARAWDFVRMATQDTDYMEAYAQRTGEYLSNETVMDSLEASGSSATLNGQNHYAFFNGQAELINISGVSPYDMTIDNIVMSVLDEYVSGQYATRDAALAEVTARVQAEYPGLSYP